jgi:hypothetical protein
MLLLFDSPISAKDLTKHKLVQSIEHKLILYAELQGDSHFVGL